MIYGLPNRIISNILSEFFKHEHLSKMLYYVEKEYEKEDVLKLNKVSWGKELVQKCIFNDKRIPIVLKHTGAFMSLRIFDYYPMNKKDMYEVLVDIDMITHKECQKTIHGSRDACILAMVHESLSDWKLNNAIGRADILSTYDIRDLDSEYSGYTVKVKVQGFSQKPSSELPR